MASRQSHSNTYIIECVCVWRFWTAPFFEQDSESQLCAFLCINILVWQRLVLYIECSVRTVSYVTTGERSHYSTRVFRSQVACLWVCGEFSSSGYFFMEEAPKSEERFPCGFPLVSSLRFMIAGRRCICAVARGNVLNSCFGAAGRCPQRFVCCAVARGGVRRARYTNF